jgi:hypothetical protein
LVCAPGTDLDLAAGASIVSYSPLEFRGSEDAPIRIHSSDGSGRGLAVLRAGAESQLEHVRFHNLSNPSHGGWEPTGAVTFYESPVRISHSEFASNRSEDGLNVIRSDFSIETTLFRDTRSDAFDADFADGSITRSSFVRAGNDAIDVSGSRVALRQIRVNGAGDKGVSGGENAQLSVDGLDVRDAVIGVASKDMSRIEVHSLEVRRAEIGLAVFQKKSEFGPASIEARELSLDAVRTPYLVETGSTLIVKGKSIAANGERLREALYSAKGVVNAEQGG